MDEPTFWQTLGYDSASKQHLASEWQDIIFAEDLTMAISNFNLHCADPNHKYDQVVKDEQGNPIRMLEHRMI
jgi:hypothetical protein